MTIKRHYNGMNTRQSGFTLIEVMIALVVLAAGLLALATMQIVSIRSNSFSSEMTYASILAQSRLEQIRNTPYGSVNSGTFSDVVPASPSTKGMAYTVQTTVTTDGNPAPNMRAVNLQITWLGSPAGSTGSQSVTFTARFGTVIKR